MSIVKKSAGERLRFYRDALKLSQQELADLIGASQGYLADIETGRSKPSRAFLEKLLKKTNVNTDWILTGGGEMKRQRDEPPGRIIGRIVGFRGGELDRNEFVAVAYYDVPVSAGAGTAALEEPATRFNAYRVDYLARRGLIAKNLIELPIAGDSMSPELESGDTVLVDRSRTNVAGDGIYVLALDGQLFCKRLQLMPGRVLRVTSINTNYPPYDVRLADDGQEEHFEIIGRVVRQGRDR